MAKTNRWALLSLLLTTGSCFGDKTLYRVVAEDSIGRLVSISYKVDSSGLHYWEHSSQEGESVRPVYVFPINSESRVTVVFDAGRRESYNVQFLWYPNELRASDTQSMTYVVTLQGEIPCFLW